MNHAQMLGKLWPTCSSSCGADFISTSGWGNPMRTLVRAGSCESQPARWNTSDFWLETDSKEDETLLTRHSPLVSLDFLSSLLEFVHEFLALLWDDPQSTDDGWWWKIAWPKAMVSRRLAWKTMTWPLVIGNVRLQQIDQTGHKVI